MDTNRVTAGKLKAGVKELTGAQVSLASGEVANSSNETVTASDTALTPEQSVKVMNAAVGNGNGVTTGTWQTTGVNYMFQELQQNQQNNILQI